MKCRLLFFLICLVCMPNAWGNAWGPCTSVTEKLDLTNDGFPSYELQGLCKSEKRMCCGEYMVRDCESCSGTSKQRKLTGVPNCNDIYYDVCESGGSGTNCNDCDGKCKGEYWQRIKEGYEQKLNETCNRETCECYTMLAVEYQCESGYRQEGDKVSCTMNINGGDVECYGCKKCSAEDKAYGADKNENCITSIDWVRYSEGYEYKKNANFNSEDCSCEITKEYRCADGWYGVAFYNFLNRGVDGCKLCPEAENIFTDEALTKKARGTSVAGSNSDAKNCYLKNDTYYMKSGTVKITNSGDNTCQYVK